MNDSILCVQGYVLYSISYNMSKLFNLQNLILIPPSILKSVSILLLEVIRFIRFITVIELYQS